MKNRKGFLKISIQGNVRDGDQRRRPFEGLSCSIREIGFSFLVKESERGGKSFSSPPFSFWILGMLYLARASRPFRIEWKEASRPSD